VTFGPDYQVNTTAFDPDRNAPCRFGPAGCGDFDTVNTLRIGEYNGVAVGGGKGLAVWTGNDALGDQDTVFGTFTACTNACPFSQGYWKNHADAWPVLSLTLGTQTYTEAELLDLLRTPVRNDASLILVHQLIAAKLAFANGSDATPIAATIADADALLSALSGRLPYGVRVASATGQAMVHDSDLLDLYNNAGLTPTCVPPFTTGMGRITKSPAIRDGGALELRTRELSRGTLKIH
jgi:hypothetical protein